MYPGLVKSTGLVFAEKPSIGIEPTNLPDRSRYGNDGVHTDITMVQLPSGLWVRRLDGSNAYITCPNHPVYALTISMTFLIWARLNVLDASSTLFDRRSGINGYRFEYRGDAKIGFFTGNGTNFDNVTSGVGFIGDNEWHLITGSRSAAKAFVLTVDGVSIRETTGSYTISDANIDLFIGIQAGLGGDTNGDLALPRIYNYVLNPAQIRAIYTAEKHWFGL